MSVGVIILAAGKGTRMKTDKAKVLHEACGRTLLGWVIAISDSLDPDEIVVVAGHESDRVINVLPDTIIAAIQEPQNGTGHAADVGLGAFSSPHDTVVVLPGDMPLIRSETLNDLVAAHEASSPAATVLTVVLDDPSGYGRIIRVDESVKAIVEERDATEDQLSVREVNTSAYVFSGALLGDALAKVGSDNDQGEQYLTDVVEAFVSEGHRVAGFTAAEEEGLGVNSQAQLAEAAAVLRSRINQAFLAGGVWMLDPSRVYIDADVIVEAGVHIFPDTYLTGDTTVAAGAKVGPSVQAHDTTIGMDSTVLHSVLNGARIGADASVGPYTYLRPGAVLKDGAKAGAHVEIKNSEVGARSKVPHLSYIGDATIGEDSNIGAATVTVNYDGYAKHRTTIGDRVMIGSDSMLIAPVTIEDDAVSGAGSVITNDIPQGSLGIERGVQHNIPDYAERRRRRVEEESD
jgi:bifunctional UDP-N-acetylglucosamine pyrophosphorylase/glucosamine-1-phosphate N-acetyltransferase